jgi:drug/metabolite transporter (DMT)-like permease
VKKGGEKAMRKTGFTSIAPILAVLAGCMWGSVGFFVRNLSDLNIDNMTIVGCRMAGALVIMVIFLLIYDKKLLKIKLKDSWCFIGAGMVSMVFLNFFYNAAINITSLSLSAILLSTAPIFVLFLSRFIFGEKITKIKLMSFFLAFGGCILVSGIFERGAAFSLLGIIMGLTSALFYALYSIFSRFAMNKGYHSLTITVYSFLFATIGGAFFSDFHTIAQEVGQSPLPLGLFLFFHSLIAAAAPYILFTFSLKYLDIGRASILASGEPVTATLIGLLIFKEVPSLISVVGIMLVLTALALLSKPDKNIIQEKA